MQPVRLSLEAPRVEGPGPVLVVAAVLEHPDGQRHQLWWRLPPEWREALTPWADPFVVGLIFPMMSWKRDVVVEGAVSPSLLANLEQYMAIWRAWRPQRYQPVEIHAREETESPPPAEPGQTIMPFSCGVDSSFTLYRHRRHLVGRRTKRITAAMVLYGFDIQFGQANAPAMYQGLLAGARIMTQSMDVACISAASNFHELPTDWFDTFASHLVSGLRLLAGRFDAALLANDVAYPRMGVVHGSHPMCNLFLSSRHFQVIDDGGEASRCEKLPLLARWPEAMRHLRVCFDNPGSHANCCRCEKCVRTILSFRAMGVGRPPAFAQDVTNRQIRRMRFPHEYNVGQWREILQGVALQAEEGRGDCGWVRAVQAAIRRNQRRWKWQRFKRMFLPLRNRLRRLLRGSPLSRRQLQQLAQSRKAAGRVGPRDVTGAAGPASP
jgi:hypothetical protein